MRLIWIGTICFRREALRCCKETNPVLIGTGFYIDINRGLSSMKVHRQTYFFLISENLFIIHKLMTDYHMRTNSGILLTTVKIEIDEAKKSLEYAKAKLVHLEVQLAELQK